MTTQHPVELGMVGLGRMGANLVRRAMRDGHSCVVTDVNPQVKSVAQAERVRATQAVKAKSAPAAPAPAKPATPDAPAPAPVK